MGAKIRESAKSVLPLVIAVSLLCLFLCPVQPELLLCFLLGAVMLTVGMGLFSVGADQAMTPIGNKAGTAITKTKKLPIILGASFLMGLAVTVAEPDLHVLAKLVPHIDSFVLLITVGAGVGLLMAVCMLRILTGMRLRYMLCVLYAAVFVLAAFSDADFLGVAFDSGGVTTGPMTVPFILAVGVGVSNIRSDRRAHSDSFGLVALCSVGPILAVLILGFFYSGNAESTAVAAADYISSKEIGAAFLREIPVYMKETAVALLPIILVFLLFQLITKNLSGRGFVKILIGILYTYAGLVLFLTGVNASFCAAGAELGASLVKNMPSWVFVPVSMLLGWFIISAEPAVGILEKQIESVSAGAIPGNTIKYSLCAAVSLAMGLSALRVVTGISIMWFLVPGYTAAIILSFFAPDIYTAIAFDSGGVASGPMTAAFMLQFFMGAVSESGGNILHDAFGVVAAVAMMPLLTVQTVGLIYEIRSKRVKTQEAVCGDLDIIELWEEAA